MEKWFFFVIFFCKIAVFISRRSHRREGSKNSSLPFPTEFGFESRTMLNRKCNCAFAENSTLKDCAKETKTFSWKHEFIFPLVSFNDCTYIIALVLLKVFLSAFSNISSFGLEGCDILVLPRKNFLVGKVFLSFVIETIFWQSFRLPSLSLFRCRR